MQLPFFDESALRARVDMPAAIAAVRRGFEALHRGEARIPVRTVIEAADGATLFMPGSVDDEDGPGVVGLKVVSVRSANRTRGLPAIHAVVLLVDPVTGVPRAAMDARWLTALRTGAATGVATDLLARPDATVLGVVGAGAQARCQIEAVAAVRSLAEVRIASRGGESARRLAGELSRTGLAGAVRAVADARTAVADADVVVTVTDSVTPVFGSDDVAPGAHVNAVGGYTTAMQELPTGLMARATRIVVDAREAALAEAGDVTEPLARGVLAVDDLVELGAVAAGDAPGRTSPGDLTVFKSVGNAVQDLVVARLALDG